MGKLKNKIAVLLNHELDMTWAESQFCRGSLLIAHEQHTCQILNHVHLVYFYTDSEGKSSQYDEIKHLAHNWYRDEQGSDLSFARGISPGQIVSGSAWIAFASIYKEYNAIKRWLERVDVLYVSRNEHPQFIRVAKKFGERIRIYDPGHDVPCLRTACGERRLGEFPKIHWLSWVARLVQKPVMSLVRRRKHLYTSDWTSDIAASQDADGLHQNSPCPWKAFYFSYQSHFANKAMHVFPEALGDYASASHLGEVLQRKGVRWDEALLALCSEFVKDNYRKNRPVFLRTYAVYCELLHYYRPSLCLVQSEIYEPYTIIIQIAKSLGIATCHLVDGFGILAPARLSRDETGDGCLFDKFAAFGEVMRDNYLLVGVKPGQCILRPAPLLKHHENLMAKETCYDTLIMTWVPMHLNPASREDYGSQIATDVIRLLLDLGKKRIALKIKSERERHLYETVLKAEGLLDKIDILTGYYYEHVLKAQCVVGGISTGIVETFYHDIPFYLYEPYENGYSDAMMAKSTLISPDGVARTINGLRSNILKQRVAVQADRSYVFHGM